MNCDELFQALKREESQAAWERLVAQAMADGISLDEIRDMLDYLENSRRQPQNVTTREKHVKHSWLACFIRRATKA